VRSAIARLPTSIGQPTAAATSRVIAESVSVQIGRFENRDSSSIFFEQFLSVVFFLRCGL
jgi:hypothetical protein